jgi:hypothetical protein
MKIEHTVEQWTNTKYFAVLFLFYSVIHGGILFIPNAIFWDDWTLYRVEEEVILDTFRQAGDMLNIFAHLHNNFLDVGPWLYRVLTFILMFSVGISLNSILSKHKALDRETRFLIVLLFLIMPFYWARVALIDMPYTICYFLFFLAWSLVDKYRTISSLLFFLSFNTNSLLVFYALPFLDRYYRSIKEPISLKSFIQFGARNLDYLVLPFLYFAIKLIFFEPFGLYKGYNQQYSLRNLVAAPALMFLDWGQLQIPLLGATLLCLPLYFVTKSLFTVQEHTAKTSKIFIFLGAGVFCTGAFPYWILGHVPSFTEWTSRHQLLLPLGASLFFVGALGYFSKVSKTTVITILISVCLILNLRTYKDFFLDWQKQKELISLFKQSAEIREAEIVVFNDMSASLNAIKRSFRSYEWNGLMVEAFDNEKRLGLAPGDFDSLKNGQLYKGYFLQGKKYRMGDFRLSRSPKVLLVDIETKPTKLLDRVRRFGLLELQLFVTRAAEVRVPDIYLPE